MADETLYEVLGLTDSATQGEIDDAYRRLVKQVHPDSGGSPALFRTVQEAHETLSDPVKRAAYDRLRKQPPGARDEGAVDEETGWVRVEDSDVTDPPPRAGPDPTPPPSPPPPPPSPPQPARGDAWLPPWPPPTTPNPEPRWAGFSRRHPIIALALVVVVGLMVLSMLRSLSGALLLGFAFIGWLFFRSGAKGSGWAALARADIRSLDALTDPQFERFMEQFFDQLGYRVRRMGASGDFGADLVLDGPEGRTVVQAKRSSAIVGDSTIQEVVAAKAPYQANRAMVVTTSAFSEHARTLAHLNGVVLWERRELARELARVKRR